ncbi:MAG: 2-oxo acid dehydrogenase subunit E2 [Thermoplasmata archaeon]|nr:2-oxo acid dehydrogenase subunit E2 [Thermoplasmata archaeon]
MGDYEIRPFSKERRNISILLSETEKKHIIHAILEMDVTEARKRIREQKKNGKDISFTAWIIKCIATVMEEQKEFNALRHGKRKIVFFHDVDVAIPMEREINGERTTMAYIIRGVNRKSIDEITREIRDAQKEEVEGKEQVLGRKGLMERFAIASPDFVKKILLLIASRNAFLRKRYMGTTAVSAVGMIGNFQGWLLIMGGHFTTQFGVGGIVEKPVFVDGDLEKKEYIRLIISVDHDIIDGAPLARFSSRLVELMEGSSYL